MVWLGPQTGDWVTPCLDPFSVTRQEFLSATPGRWKPTWYWTLPNRAPFPTPTHPGEPFQGLITFHGTIFPVAFSAYSSKDLE